MQSDLLSVVYVYKTDARLRIEIEFADPPPLQPGYSYKVLGNRKLQFLINYIVVVGKNVQTIVFF